MAAIETCKREYQEQERIQLSPALRSTFGFKSREAWHAPNGDASKMTEAGVPHASALAVSRLLPHAFITFGKTIQYLLEVDADDETWRCNRNSACRNYIRRNLSLQ